MRRSVFTPYIAIAAIAGSLLFLTTRCDRPGPVHCAEATIISDAWKKALELSKVEPGSIQRPESIRVVYEARWYPYGPFGIWTRICGATEWYFPEEPVIEGQIPLADIQLYVAPGDCGMLYDVMVHEFLHAIHAIQNRGLAPDDEAVVRQQWPKECH